LAFFELRQYVIKPGQMAAWIKLFDEEILPFQVGKGMVVTGVFRGEADNAVFIWIRRFESEADRERLYAAVYETEYWKNDMSPRIGDLIDRSQIKVQRIVASKMSSTQ
jgi:hypothetical protein